MAVSLQNVRRHKSTPRDEHTSHDACPAALFVSAGSPQPALWRNQTGWKMLITIYGPLPLSIST